MAAASSLRNGAFSLLRQRMALRMSTNTGGGGGPATGGAANSGGATNVVGDPSRTRLSGSGRAATGGGGGASTGGGGGGVSGGAATGGGSNSGGRGDVSGGAATTGGGGGGPSGEVATGVAELRKDIFKETRRLCDRYNMLAEVDRNLFGEIARLEMDNAMNRVNAKMDLVSTTYKLLGATAAFIIAGASCLGPYIKESVVHDAAKEVDERMRLRKLNAKGEGGDKTAAAPGDAAPTIKVDTKPAAAPTGGSAASSAGAPGAPAPKDVKKKAAAAPAAGSASVNKLDPRITLLAIDPDQAYSPFKRRACCYPSVLQFG